MSAGAPTLECRITGAGTVQGVGLIREVSHPLRASRHFGFAGFPRGLSGSLEVTRVPRGSSGLSFGACRGLPKRIGVFRGPPGSFDVLEAFRCLGINPVYSVIFWFRSVIGLCQQVHRSVLVFGREVSVWDKFRIQCLRTGVAFVFLSYVSRKHSSIRIVVHL